KPWSPRPHRWQAAPPNAWSPPCRPSPVAPCATRNSPTSCWSSRSTPWSTSSACVSAAPSPTPSSPPSPTASPPANCPPRTRTPPPPAWSARSARCSSARWPPTRTTIPSCANSSPSPCAPSAPRPRQVPSPPPIREYTVPTHEVFNQAPDITPFDFSRNPALLEGLRREGAAWAEDEVRELGRLAGSPRVQEWGRLANEYPPVLRTHDRYGHRVDEVEFHPHWHDLMTVAVEHGLHGAPWLDDRPGAHVARAAKFYTWGFADAGHMCPISMTYAVVPALRHNRELAARYEPLLGSRTYDFGLREPSTKAGLIAGMSMTEKQGGSDVRANTTTATPRPDGSYRVVGHKWFTSAPMSDMFLTLAQAPGGLSCFLLPRVLPDGTRNPIRIQRLKDKLGNKSNASSEIEYENATGWLVGAEGAGVKTIIEMVNMTRLDCVIGSATGMRMGAVAAVHHARHRKAFGAKLIDQPAMRNVLADLVIESDAATTVMMRLAGATDRAGSDPAEAALRRIALAITKYWVCKRAP